MEITLTFCRRNLFRPSFSEIPRLLLIAKRVSQSPKSILGVIRTLHIYIAKQRAMQHSWTIKQTPSKEICGQEKEIKIFSRS